MSTSSDRLTTQPSLAGSPDTASPPAPKGYLAALAALCACTALVVGMVASVNLAVPKLAASGLNPSASALVWIVDSYVVFFACLVIPGGAAGDRLGRKGVLLSGLGIFAVGALISATGPDVAAVVLGRAVSGVGAAAVLPNTLAILIHMVPAERRARAIATWASMTGLGGILGNIGGGAILQSGSWRWLFVVGALLAGAGAAWVGLSTTASARHRRGLDRPGTVLLTLACLTLLIGIIQGPESGWTSPWVVGGFAAAVLLTLGWLRVELRADEPLLDPRLFRIPVLRAGCLGLFVMFFGMFALFYVNASFLQYVKSYSVLRAGIAVAPMAVVMVVAAQVAGPLAARMGRHWLIALAFLLSGGGLLGLSASDTGTGYPVYAGYLLVVGAGIGLALPGLSADIAGGLPATHAGVGGGLQSTTRELGSALGVAVIGSIITSRFVHALPDALSHHGHTVARALSGAPSPGAPSPGARLAVQHAYVLGTQAGLRTVAVITLAGGLLVTATAARRGTASARAEG